MKYSNEFKTLLKSMSCGYIGHGNPNARILIIGQEPAIDPQKNQEQYQHEIADNVSQWKDIVESSTGYETIDHSENVFGSPLHPWANQKYQVRSGLEETGNLKAHEGTARTWYNYQKLINNVLELYSPNRNPLTKNDYLDFHRYSFHSDMSDAASKEHRMVCGGKLSVQERIPIFSSDYFCSFPIVVAAVGHFPRETYGDNYFGDVFNVKFLGNVGDNREWININIREDINHPMLLIHCLQFANTISDAYIKTLANYIVEFAEKRNIDLMPLE